MLLYNVFRSKMTASIMRKPREVATFKDLLLQNYKLAAEQIVTPDLLSIFTYKEQELIIRYCLYVIQVLNLFYTACRINYRSPNNMFWVVRCAKARLLEREF